ncbi:hypothetical protein ACSSV4_002284 [Roseovarius sp. MBR-154]|jgi:hypothetical protein
MTLSHLPPAVRWLLPFTVMLAIASMPLTWINLTTVGGFNLQLPYVMAILLGASLCLFPGQLALGLQHLPTLIAPWLIAYVFYLVVLHVGLAGGSSNGMVLRQVFFLICGCTFALGLVASGANAKAIRYGGLLAIIGFLAVVEVLARQLGLSWVMVIERFLATGDLEFIFYQFLKQLFQLVAANGSEAQASEKNMAAVAILTGLILFRAGHVKAAPDRFGQIVTVLVLGVLLLLNTRSVLLMVVLGLALAGWIGMMRRGVHSTGEFIFKSAAYIGIIIVSVLILSTDSASIAQMTDRFSFSDDSSGNRFRQYAWALERIEANPLWGSGLAEYNGQPVHNLFLSAWMYAGIFAFLLVIFVYVFILGTAFVFVIRVATQPAYWALPIRPEWIAVLPIVPIFRVWIAGDSGHPSFVEWSTICLFFSFLLANRLQRRAAQSAA